LFSFGCKESSERNIITNEKIVADSCQKIQLGDSLVLGLRVSMTEKEYKAHLGSLISSGVLGSDSTLKLEIPALVDQQEDNNFYRFKLEPTFEGCYLTKMKLKNDIDPIFGIREVLLDKYGPIVTPPIKPQVKNTVSLNDKNKKISSMTQKEIEEAWESEKSPYLGGQVVNTNEPAVPNNTEPKLELINEYWVTDKNKIVLKGYYDYGGSLSGVEIIYESIKIIREKEQTEFEKNEIKKNIRRKNAEKASKKIKDIL
jgi:hypothetical protein